MSRRVISIISLFLLLFSIFAITVSATEVDPDVPEDPIDPDEPYVEIALMTAGCTISSTGLATCSSLVQTAHSGYTIYLSVSLMRYTSGSWQLNAGPWYSSGTQIATVYKQHFVVSGYYYCTVVYATVFDSNGNFVETALYYSPVRYY